MKVLIYLVGVSCAGKSYFAKALSNKLNMQYHDLDDIYKAPFPETPQQRLLKYNSFFNSFSDERVSIIEGFMPFTEKDDWGCFNQVTKDMRIIYVVIKPSFEKYCENISKREKQNAIFYVYNKEEYDNRYNKLIKEIGREYILFESDDDLNKITQSNILHLSYQHIGVTDVRWEQLRVPCIGNSILDIGCCSGMYETLSFRDGAIEYKGIDVTEISKYISKNISIFNANNLEEYNNRADVVISTSMFHYISDKEKFIRECSRIAKKLFILETPISQLDKEIEEIISDELYYGLHIPTKPLIEKWIKKYFREFECIGEGISQNGSKRLIWHCKK